MAGAQQRLAFRNLPAATLDSSSILPAFQRDLVERPPVAVQHRLPSREPLPPDDRHVYILRVDVDSIAQPPCALGRDQAAARSEEWVIHLLTLLRVIQDRAPHQLHRLLRPVPGDLVLLVAVAAERI